MVGKKSKLCVFLILIMLFPSALTAQLFNANKPVLCYRGDAQEFTNQLQEKYQEKLMLKGKNLDNDSIIEWYENSQTGTWTLVERKENLLCFLASGENGKGI